LGLAVVASVLAAVWAGPVAQAFGGAEAPEPVSMSSYVVRSGDTLWSIAERVAPGRDPRPLVEAISEANRVDAGALVPGRTLVIPVAG
jgi:nucleoid-associated protein YgaU